MGAPEWLNVGIIVKPQGLRGEVKVKHLSDVPDERFAKDRTLTLFHEQMGAPTTVTVEYSRPHKGTTVVKFYEYSTIDQVEPLRGALLKIPLADAGSLDKNEYFFHEIIGCEVWTTEGERIGVVTDILTPGANDVWVVRRNARQPDLYLPYIADVVKKVDTSNRRIEIQWMDGLG